jgi:hypothetical protein
MYRLQKINVTYIEYCFVLNDFVCLGKARKSILRPFESVLNLKLKKEKKESGQAGPQLDQARAGRVHATEWSVAYSHLR